jgi:hypothetical protein
VIEITVGDIDLVGGGIDRHVRGLAKPRGIQAVGLVALLADLHDEFSVARELQYVAIALAVGGEPDKTFLIDIDAVLIVRPVIPFAFAAPRLDQVSLLIELHHRRCRHAAFGSRRRKARRLFVVGQGLWTLHHPDMILRIHGDAGCRAHDPVVGQRLRPKGVDLEFRRVGGVCSAQNNVQKNSRTASQPLRHRHFLPSFGFLCPPCDRVRAD